MADIAKGSLSVRRGPPGSGTRLEAVQFLPQSRERLFEFFADAFELQTITPPWLHFRVLTPPPIAIAAGTLIDYRLRLHGIPLRWRSCIRVWEPPWRFVDEQVRGPYRRWHHEHVLEEAEGGTQCIDRVDYSVSGGRWVDWLLVRRDVQRIFAYRQRKLAQLFGASHVAQMHHERTCECQAVVQ